MFYILNIEKNMDKKIKIIGNSVARIVTPK